jgi:hypothetical protein
LPWRGWTATNGRRTGSRSTTCSTGSATLGADTAFVATVTDDGALFIASNEQLRCDHPGLVRVQSDDHACATLPLFDDVGVLAGVVPGR